ncbi:MAG: EAL domain-containing protein, partial [Janthinobacterium sp.]
GAPASMLILEVTEGVLIDKMEDTIDRMAQLAALGLRFSIDDFGTGYSSLSALKSFPISTLKIDKSFVRDLGRSDGDEAIATSIIGLAHRLKLRVIAEGVETEQQRSFLSDNGCDELQGYLISRPLPAEQLALLCHGLSLDDQPLKPAKVDWQNPEQLRFVLTEGKKRQIRRMCEQVGLKVVGLKRIRIGNVVL